jgi:transcriptional regulator with XRE-family HTH domain
MEISEKIFIENFGFQVRKIRTAKNLSQEMLANDSDIPINQIGRIERAEINTSLITIYKIAQGLEIDIKDLFDF